MIRLHMKVLTILLLIICANSMSYAELIDKSPKKACNALPMVKMYPSGWKYYGDPTDLPYACASAYYIINPPNGDNTIAYYVYGNKSQAKQLMIDAFVGNLREEKKTLSILITAGNKLAQKATGGALPENILKAIGHKHNAEANYKGIKIKVIRENHNRDMGFKGYSLKVTFE